MKFENDDLVSIIRAYRENSLGAEDGELSNERASAMDRYHGRPYGDEQEGRSTVTSRALSETIDWILPSLLKMFIQSGNVVEFTPNGPEDEPLAEQESFYTNYVIMEDNPGFMLLHDWFKDALILKNGYIKHFYDESEDIKEDDYEGLTLEQLTVLMSELEACDGEVDIKSQKENIKIIDTPMGEVEDISYDVTIQTKTKKGKFVLEVVPPEEIRISKRARGSTQDAEFIEHVTLKTRSELIQMGMDKDFVNELSAYNGQENDSEQFARDSVYDEQDSVEGLSLDRSLDEIEYCEAYLRVDYDDDGIAELRKVVTVSEEIPPGDEWNEPIDCVPITSIAPKRIPHRHIGESLYDDIEDLQRIDTVLLRQLLDNVYLTNNQQFIVNDRVNLKDFAKSVPGGFKRIKDNLPVTGAVEPIQTTPILNQILPAIDHISNLREFRTGVNKTFTGNDPDIIKQGTNGAYQQNLLQSNQQVEMIGRMFAEGVKELSLRVHELLIKHHDKPRKIKLTNDYIDINPQEWKERNNLRVKVGLGTGTQDQKRQNLLMLASLQERAAQADVIGPQEVYNLFTDIAETIGPEAQGRYVMDPKSPEFIQRMQSKAQNDDPIAKQLEQATQVEAMKNQTLIQKANIEAQQRIQEMQMEFKQREQDMVMKHNHFLEELDLKQQEIDRKREADLDNMEAKLTALEVELRKAGSSQQIDGGLA